MHLAHEEGLIRNTSIHAGIRAPLIRPKGDLRNDLRCGFEIVHAREIDYIGVKGVIQRIMARVGDSKVYLSVDIDVLDPAFAPGKSKDSFDMTCQVIVLVSLSVSESCGMHLGPNSRSAVKQSSEMSQLPTVGNRIDASVKIE